MKVFGPDVALKLFANTARGAWIPTDVPKDKFVVAYRLHTHWTARLARLGTAHPFDAIRQQLTGLDLACWCPLDRPCHADVLLEIANV